MVVDEMIVSGVATYENGGEVLDNGNCITEHGWLSFRHLDLLQE